MRTETEIRKDIDTVFNGLEEERTRIAFCAGLGFGTNLERARILEMLRSEECQKAEWSFGWGHELSHKKLADWIEAQLSKETE